MAVKNQFRGSEERIRLAAEMGAELVGPELNFARLADTFGIFGQRVEQPDAIEPAIKRAMEQNGPALVDVVIGQNTRKGLTTRYHDEGHEEPSAAESQPNLEISRARREGRKVRSLGMKVIRKVSFFLLKLGDFAPWRENSRTPSAISFRIICAGHANFQL